MAKADTPLATYDAIVIGTGQAGPPLARRLAAGRMRVARSDDNVVVGVDCTEGPPEIRGSPAVPPIGPSPRPRSDLHLVARCRGAFVGSLIVLAAIGLWQRVTEIAVNHGSSPVQPALLIAQDRAGVATRGRQRRI